LPLSIQKKEKNATAMLNIELSKLYHRKKRSTRLIAESIDGATSGQRKTGTPFGAPAARLNGVFSGFLQVGEKCD
jgi:hypothetical protein